MAIITFNSGFKGIRGRYMKHYIFTLPAPRTYWLPFFSGAARAEWCPIYNPDPVSLSIAARPILLSWLARNPITKKAAASFNRPTECKPLLEAATKDLFRKNAFRVLGLAVDATNREVSKHGVKMKQMEELGLGKASQAGAFPMSPPPSHDEIRATIQKLQDAEKRLVDELFLVLAGAILEVAIWIQQSRRCRRVTPTRP